MFDSVLRQRKLPERRLGTGAVLSVLGHGVLFGALLLSSKDSVQQAAEGVTVTFFAQAPRPAAPGPPALAAASPVQSEAAAPRRVTPRPIKSNPVSSRVTTEKAVPTPEEVEEVPKTEATGAIGTRSGSEPSGGAVGSVGPATGTSGGSSQGVPGGKGTAAPSRSTHQILPFGPGMTRPRLISGRDPAYTAQAYAAKVSGVMIVKCVITTAGTIQGCRIIKGLPHMDRAVLDAMAGRRYTPVMYQGRAVAVDYVFNIKLVLPNR